MQSDVQIVRRPQEESQLVQIDDANDQEHAVNPLLLAHRLLQGKYPLVIVLALIFGLMAGVVTHHFVKDSYTSTGMVQVLPTLPMLLYHTEYNDRLSEYEDYVGTQAQLVLSERVMDLAAQDPDWQQLTGMPAPDSSAMAASIKIAHEPGEIIKITYSDPNPLRPAVAVNTIIKAYLALYSNSDEETKAAQLQKLEEIKADLTKNVAAGKQRILEIAKEYGVTDLQAEIVTKDQEISSIKGDLRRIELELAGNADGGNATTRPAQLTPDQWGQYDPEMRDLLHKKQAAQLELQQALDTGIGENNPQVQRLRDAVSLIDVSIIQRQQFDDANIQPAANSALGLHRQKDALTLMLNADIAEQTKMQAKNLAIKDLVDKTAAATKELDATTTRVHELELESIGKGRITAAAMGSRPQLDSGKRIIVSLAGGVAGGMGVVGFFVVMGLANRKMRHIADIQQDGTSANKGMRLLGAVPMLSADGSMGDNTPAAQAVHRIRTRLQIEAATADHRVMTVTSPASGNGKTSVVTALGMSFASSGSRVLLIDCDLVGAGLTARLNGRVRRNIVDILRTQTNITEEQLAQAARVANKSSDRFLQALIDFEYLSQEAVKRAVTTHKESNLGLLDALNGDPLNQCVAATRWPRLFVLPRGAATGSDAAQLSPLSLRRLFQQARNTYDVILVDTGPLFGSIEATLAASESDGTVLIISRGESAAAVQAAITDLKSMNCKVLGVVFNRAKARDVASYGYSSKSSSRSRPVASLGNDDVAVGPVAASVSGRNGSGVLKKMA